MMEEVKGYSESREEEEEEEEESGTAREEERLHQQEAAPRFITNPQRKQLELMELSLGSSKEEETNLQQGCSSQQYSHGHGHGLTSNNEASVEKEHMFDKVVTPSDVGKLNRLVIPKQHAEKYFPLDSSSNEKGLLLNFEDRNGKLWRFRYSYWNSSQSYVMTKGWSRFVKEKKLDAGDIVSFQRGLGDLFRHRLYIDWRRRPDHPPGPDHHHHHHHHHPSASLITPFFLPIRWGGRLYSSSSSSSSSTVPPPPPPPRHHDHFPQQLNYNHMYAFHHHHHQQHHQYHLNSYGGDVNSGSGSVYYLRSTPSASMVDQNIAGQQQERGTVAPMIIDSVPIAHHHHQHQHQQHHLQHGATANNNSGGAVASSSGANTTAAAAGKRLRLFGVNMECSSSAEESNCFMPSSASAAQVNVTMPNSLHSSSSLQLSSSARFGDQRGETSVLFDLDPSLQYRQ